MADAGRVIQNVGRRVAELRIERGWTQEMLAERLGVSLKYVQSVEAGRENLTLQSLVKLANNLRAEVIALFQPARTRNAGPGRPPTTGRSSRKPLRAAKR
jgi:transcriptional regulator with XRE-family HTH domain